MKPLAFISTLVLVNSDLRTPSRWGQEWRWRGESDMGLFANPSLPHSGSAGAEQQFSAAGTGRRVRCQVPAPTVGSAAVGLGWVMGNQRAG